MQSSSWRALDWDGHWIKRAKSWYIHLDHSECVLDPREDHNFEQGCSWQLLGRDAVVSSQEPTLLGLVLKAERWFTTVFTTVLGNMTAWGVGILISTSVPDTQLWLGLFCFLAIISYMPDLTNHVHLQIKNRVLNKSSLSGSFFFHLSERNNPKLFIYWPGN